MRRPIVVALRLRLVPLLLALSSPVLTAGAGHAAPAKTYTLADLIDLARKQNPGLAAGAQATAGVEAQLAEARRSWLPTGEFLTMLAPSPEIFCEPDPQNCVRTNSYEASLSLRGIFTRSELRLTQPVYTFGKISAGKQAAERGVQASRSRELAMAADVELNVRRAYFGYKLAREILATLDEGLEYLDDARKRIDAALKAGKEDVSQRDRFRMESVRSEVLSRRLEARRGLDIAVAALRALIGPDAPAEIAIDDEELKPVDVPVRPASYYVAQAQDARPELRALTNFVASKQALAELERRKQFPDLVIVGAATYAYSSSIDNPKNAFYSDPYNTLSAGLAAALRMPLDLGVKNARATRLRAEAEEAGHRRTEAVAGVAFEVRRAHTELMEAQERVKVAQGGEKAGRSWITSITQSFELGLAEMRDFADALSAYFLARVRHLQAVHDGHIAAAALSRATGVLVN